MVRRKCRRNIAMRIPNRERLPVGASDADVKMSRAEAGVAELRLDDGKNYTNADAGCVGRGVTGGRDSRERGWWQMRTAAARPSGRGRSSRFRIGPLRATRRS